MVRIQIQPVQIKMVKEKLLYFWRHLLSAAK